MKNFFILSLPRSRTAWLANFLTYENSYCFHEGLLDCESVPWLHRLFEETGKPIRGNSDCGNIIFLEKLRKSFPDAKYVIVERHLGEVVDELHEIGLESFQPEVMEYADSQLKLAKRTLDALTVNFHELDESACRQIWRHCIGTPFDEARWRMLDGMDIQIILAKKIELMRKKKSNIESLMGREH